MPVDAQRGGARPAPALDSSAEAGGDSHARQERIAALGDEPRPAEKAQAMERSGEG